MLTNYLIYETATGRIVKTIYIDTDIDSSTLPSNVISGEAYIAADVGLDYTTSYILGGVVTPLIEFDSNNTLSSSTILADGMTLLTFGPNLPAGTTVYVKSPESAADLYGSVDDGTFEIAVYVTGDYTVTLNAFPYRTFTFTFRGV